MKNVLLKSNLREIRSSAKRFVSLEFISLLGVGFFVGIKMASVDMLTTLDDYFDGVALYDLQLTSPLGFSDEGVAAVRNLDEVQTAVTVRYRDEVFQLEEGEQVVQLMELKQAINRVELTAGEWPAAANEILVEPALLEDNDLRLGDTVEEHYKIVGTVNSPLFLDDTRGTTLIGSGKVNYYAYASAETFNEEDAQSLYLLVSGAAAEVTGSEAYLEKVAQAEEAVEEIAPAEAAQRIEAVVGVTNEDLEDLYAWRLSTRDDNAAYSDLISSTDSIENIGNIFPIVFYVVAILVSLIAMKRMVEDDRGEIGTLKSLGFGSWRIIRKYLRYALLAVLIGGVLGMAAGVVTLPAVVWDLYENSYVLPALKLGLSPVYATIGLGVALLCILLATVWVATRVLKEAPASLLRPKAPKAGRRVWLEKVGPIWKRLKFSNKICIRNIFRYKSRVFAMVIGIMGSTALILTGFGLRDSLVDISAMQFGEIFAYDRAVAFTDPAADITEVQAEMVENGNTAVAAEVSAIEVVGAEKDYAANLVVMAEAEQDLMRLKDAAGVGVTLEDEKVIMTAKLAELLGVTAGERIKIVFNQHKVEYEVQAIVQNHLDHYVYMTPKTYQDTVGEYEVNTIFVRLGQSEADFEQYLEDLAWGTVVTSAEDAKQEIEDVIWSLNSVVVILIFASSVLAFVVMYNLAAININERQRELATLKVLGFYNKEVDDYINRETNLLTILGVALGLGFGYFLCHYILLTCEIDSLMFVRQINPWSYLYTILIVAVFTVAVNFFTHRQLRKIKMLESLKTVE